MRPRFYNRHVWFLLSFGILAIADHAFASRSVANYWQNTRKADLVARVKVEAVGREVRLSVLELLKGTTNSAILLVPLPDEKPRENCKPAFISFSARRWQVGEQWIVFLLSDKPVAEWKLLSAAKHAPDKMYSPLQTVRDVLQFDSLTNASEKCVFLVKLAVSGQGYSPHAARRELELLNRPEFLEYLQPVQVVLMLCWPLFVACWAGSWLLSPVRRQRRAAVLACGALAGLAIGAAAGAMIGWCHTGTPLPDILLLTPFLFLPPTLSPYRKVLASIKWVF